MFNSALASFKSAKARLQNCLQTLMLVEITKVISTINKLVISRKEFSFMHKIVLFQVENLKLIQN